MQFFTHEMSTTLHSLSSLEAVGVKIASADACVETQNTVAQGSDALYTVMYKKAMATTEIGKPTYLRVLSFIEKMAETLDKGLIPGDMQYKLAAAILADETLTEAMNSNNEVNREKLAESRVYGREFVMELLRKVI